MAAPAVPSFPVAGADGCPGPSGEAWIGFILRPHHPPEPFHAHDTAALWQLCAEAGCRRVLLDVPIGLGDDSRDCDVLARRALGPRGPSVFPAPPRWLLDCTTVEQADAEKARRTGRRAKVQRQLWNIVPRIRAVDRLLQSSAPARAIIRECHPELCFWALAGERPMTHPKRSEAGCSERIEVLERSLPDAESLIDQTLASLHALGPERDDVVDALVAALTAAAGDRRLCTFPPVPPRDRTGLAMEMVIRRG